MTRPRRVVTTGNRTVVVLGENESRVLRTDREFRFAFNSRNISRYFANRAEGTSEDDYWERKAYITGAVCMSYAYLEAALNEFVHFNAFGPKSPLDDTERELIFAIKSEDLVAARGGNTLQRYNLILRVLDREEINPGAEPYQAANAVRSLRNLLTHPVPGVVQTFDASPETDLSAQQEIVKRLRSYLGFDRTATFPESVMVPSCAVWAVKSCEAFFAAFVERTGVDPGFLIKDIAQSEA